MTTTTNTMETKLTKLADIERAAKGLALSYGFKRVDIHLTCGRMVYVDGYRGDWSEIKACKAMLARELPRLVTDRKFYHATHGGKRAWALIGGSDSIRMGLRVEITEEENTRILLGCNPDNGRGW